MLYLDGFHLKVRMARRVVAVPVLAALGVAENGQQRLAALQLATTEAQTFPKAMWKSLRTTNTLENLNREFRRRTKARASFGTEAAAITLLYGLVAFGQIVLRRIDGHEHLPAFLAKEWSQAA